MAVITIVAFLFTATLEDVLKITRIISSNEIQLKGVISTPYLILDEIPPLKAWLMRPFPGKLAEQERVFNYCLTTRLELLQDEGYFRLLCKHL